MQPVQFIEDKRDGRRHDRESLEAFVGGVANGSIPDYQIAAWLMAVVWRGLDQQETLDLTRAMANSGRTLVLSDLPQPVVDKHSTGGVGDKTSLVVVPLAAAAGLTVAKMSGRGLGFTGGTVDKLESIPGMRVELSVEEFLSQAREIRLVIASASKELAPADKRLYALRDVTGTVPSAPLIAASIMSKKLALGAPAIALDVKVGAGALMTDATEAEQLARTMVGIGEAAGRRMIAGLTSMEEPLGRAVGNALEVREAIETLQGGGPADLRDLCIFVAGMMLAVSGQAPTPHDAAPRLSKLLEGGDALEKFRQLLQAQGGDPNVVTDPDRLPSAPEQIPFRALRSGYVVRLDARAVGRAALALGAGRQKKGDAVDPAVGIVLEAKIGDSVKEGDVLAVLHARTEDRAGAAADWLARAYALDEMPPEPPRLLRGVVGRTRA